MKAMYLLFILITLPDGSEQKMDSNPMVFTAENCKKNSIAIAAAVLSKIPKAKIKTTCKPVNVYQM